MKQKIHRWITIQEYVDVSTGEKLTTEEVQNNYIITNKNKTYEINNQINPKTHNKERTATVTITNECTRKGKQLTIW